MTRPVVSIVTPVRDGARTIGETIASVQAQSESAWEHVIVDDGSTDATAAIVGAVAEPRIRYVQQPPSGRSAARNRGIELAAGDFFLFLDADDWLLPNALRDHLHFLAAHPEVGCSVTDGHFCTDQGAPLVAFSARRGAAPAADAVAELVVNPGFVGAPLAVMVRADIVRRHALRFDPDVAMGEDTLFWIDVARHAAFGFSAAVTCKYRWHPYNTTLGSSAAQRRTALWHAAQRIWRAPYFAALPEATRERFLQHALTELLADRPDEQLRVIESASFASLTPAVQARLLRLAASELVLAGQPADTVQHLLHRARALAPQDAKARLLTVLLALDPRLARLAVRMRRRAAPRTIDPLWQDGATAGSRLREG